MLDHVIQGDCLEKLKDLPDNSVDAIVTDPPYELGFMGKGWDKSGIAYNIDMWKECLRALKPGGHLLSFGGTRTYHRMACAIEDAGFEIRDQLQWIYGTGFPKNKNLGNGLGTAIKPANEPVVLARKPITEKSVGANVLKWGTGGLNIDGSRIGTTTLTKASKPRAQRNGFIKGFVTGTELEHHDYGRWPANVILDEEAAALLDQQSDGEPSRFFYVAKASRSERNFGLEEFEQKQVNDGRKTSIDNPYQRGDTLRKNTHPTVKPIKLMEHLVRLVTPPNGLVLDPFTGSGTTLIAAQNLGFHFIGIELSEEYCQIANTRLAASKKATRGNLMGFLEEND